MEELKNFYSRLLTSLMLEVIDDKIMINEEIPFKVKGKPLELYSITNRYVSGEITHVPFNILRENALIGVDPTVKVLTKFLNLNLNLSLKSLMVSLIECQLNKFEYSFNAINTHNKLFSELEGSKKAAKKLYDDLVLKNMGKLLESDLDIVKVSFRKNILIEGEKVPSAMVVSYPILDLIEDKDYEGNILKNFRSKDIRVILSIVEYFKDVIGKRLSYAMISEHTNTVCLTKGVIKAYTILDALSSLSDPNSPTFKNLFKDDISYKDISKFGAWSMYSHLIPEIDIDTDEVTEYNVSTDVSPATVKEDEKEIIYSHMLTPSTNVAPIESRTPEVSTPAPWSTDREMAELFERATLEDICRLLTSRYRLQYEEARTIALFELSKRPQASNHYGHMPQERFADTRVDNGYYGHAPQERFIDTRPQASNHYGHMPQERFADTRVDNGYYNRGNNYGNTYADRGGHDGYDKKPIRNSISIP